MHKNVAVKSFLLVICIAFISILSGFTEQKNLNDPIDDKNFVEVSQVDSSEQELQLKIKYDFKKNDPIMILNSDQLKCINIDHLEKLIGQKNIGINWDENKLTLNLSDFSKTSDDDSFTIDITSKVPFSLNVTDITGDLLADNSFNVRDDDDDDDEETEIDENSDDHFYDDPQEQDNQEWEEIDRLTISKGKTINYDTDGLHEKVTPILYFGALEYAQPDLSLQQAQMKKPSDNLTAPNSALEILVERRKESDLIYHYTNTYGDSKLTQSGRKGSHENFSTTNLFDYSSKDKIENKPRLSSLGNNLSDNPVKTYDYHLYKKEDPLTHKTMQRLTYRQSYEKYEVEITTTQRFDNDNKIVVSTSFKNTGELDIPSFSGYNFRDITFHIDKKNSDNSNPAMEDPVMRSMGASRGVIAFSKNFQNHIEFNLNGFPRAPYAWGLGTVPESSHVNEPYDYPWGNKIKYPNLATLYAASFTDLNDVGLKGNNLPIGTHFFQKGANDPDDTKFDAGLTMHTKNHVLPKDKSVSMTYGISLVRELKHQIVFNLDHDTTETRPAIIHNGEKDIPLKISWKDKSGDNEDIYYSIDRSTEFLKLKSKVTNTNKDKFNFLEINVPIEKLQPGPHDLELYLKNDRKIQSKTIHYHFKILSPEDMMPQVTIDSPSQLTSMENPFDLQNSTLIFNGTWHSLKSKSVHLEYQIDDEKTNNIFTNKVNSKPEKNHRWATKILLEQFNDLKTHQITFRLIDEEDSTKNGTEIFYFKHGVGNVEIFSPANIHFGTINLPSNTDRYVKPRVNNDHIYLKDQRGEQATPLRINLEVRGFEFEKPFLDSEEVPEHGDNPNLSPDDSDDGSIDSTKTFVPSVIWKDQLIPKDTEQNVTKVEIYQTSPNKDIWDNSKDLTNILKNNLVLKIPKEASKNPGSYVSHWTWTATDAL